MMQTVRQLTAELKDAKAAKTVNQGSMTDKFEQEMRRKLDELEQSRERQKKMLETVTNAR